MKNGFVDTNILVYAAGKALEDRRKNQIAREILLLPRLSLSVQVLSEFIATARNPKKLNLSRDQETKWLREWFEFKIGAVTFLTFQKAIEMHLRNQLSHWDSLILAAAIESRCEVLYSDDLQHGQRIEGVQVINPFLEAP